MNLSEGLASRKISTGRLRDHCADADGTHSHRDDQLTEMVIADVDASDRSGRLSSVVFPDEYEVLGELDDLYPCSIEGDDDFVAEPTHFMITRPTRATTTSPPIENNDNVMHPVDWSSLLKSCKLAKNGFQDSYSEQMVVTNMFMSNLAPLAAVLNSYTLRCCDSPTHISPNDSIHSWSEAKACTTDTKRALRFAIACLTPTSFQVNGAGQEPEPNSAHTVNGEEIYNITRPYRQNMQKAAVGSLNPVSYSEDDGTNQLGETRTQHKLHALLAIIINAERPCRGGSGDISLASESSEEEEVSFLIEEGHRKVRVLAARLLCNIVTDNPESAAIVLRDLPLSPSPDLVEMRIARSMGGYSANNRTADDSMIFWSDLITATAKLQRADTAKRDGKINYSNKSDDREALAAVAAALHNLLTSLERRPSVMELSESMKGIGHDSAKRHREMASRNGALERMERQPIIPSDMGFEFASDEILLNSLLRNILPTKAVLLQSQNEMDGAKLSRPKFIPPVSEDDSMSDSATEWISFILERLTSRGLILNMLRSVGGTSNSVTPEQVVLVSCIRQAVDDHYHALTSDSERKRTGNPRSSIVIKSSMSEHPLWGRADIGSDGKSNPASYSKIAVPVLLSIANEIEVIRVKLNSLRQVESLPLYDGEENCTIHTIEDLSDILAQCLGEHITPSREDFIADARSVIGRETSLIPSCCIELGKILDISLARNAGKKAREMQLSPQQQRTTIMLVRLIANIIYQCRYNQDILRKTPIPVLDAETASTKSAFSNDAQSSNNGSPVERTGLHVLLSTTTLSPACFTLREWCIVAIRNSVEGNEANTETVRSLEANQALNDTPELRRMGIKIDIDAKGKVNMTRGSQSSYPSDTDQVSWA